MASGVPIGVNDMLFNSIDFLLFFPLVLLVYFFIPSSHRYIWLLLSSYYFYMSWNPKYTLLLLISTLITYLCGVILKLINQISLKYIYKKLCLIMCLIINLGILGIFKYAGFALNNISYLLSTIGIQITPPHVDFLLPVGISFYTFQALSYVIDVYQGKINAETNFLRYALYVSFFPQLVAGPIEKSSDLLPQLQNIAQVNLWDYGRIKKGLFLMWGGYFQKLVIADRISLLVNTVYDNYNAYGLVEIGLATILFAFQIYCDFNGYSEIARGASQIMGIELSHNFRQPYLAKNIKDFWNRWHISLTSWFTSYLYIPLGGNRRGLLKKYINILIVFTISGLWHGAQWNFVLWGFLHGIYLITNNIKTNIAKDSKASSLSRSFRKTIFTFFLVDFAWLFFASASLKDALMMLRQALSCVYTSNILNLGLDKINWIILITALVCIIIADLFHEYNTSILEFIEKQEWWFRWSFYVSTVWIIIILGVYGTQYDTSQFIYFQF